jgi:hypothetical protein
MVRTPLPKRIWGPTFLLCSGYRWFFTQESERSGREAGHSLLYRAEVKDVWRFISIPQYVSMARCVTFPLPLLVLWYANQTQRSDNCITTDVKKMFAVECSLLDSTGWGLYPETSGVDRGLPRRQLIGLLIQLVARIPFAAECQCSSAVQSERQIWLSVSECRDSIDVFFLNVANIESLV